VKVKGARMAHKVVALVLAAFAVAIRAQDLAALLAQGQAGGLDLAQVVGALQQRGMLDQVDPNLLRRIEGQLGRNLLNEVESPREQERRPPASRLDQARERALERQRTLFGSRPSKRPTRPSRVPSRDSRNQLYGGECQALKTENRLLKQKLIQQSQEKEQPNTAIDVLKQLQDAGHFEEPLRFEGAPPLEQLLAESSVQRERGARLQVGDQREVRSILITPTPTISTILNTISFTTTVTKNITNELILNFNGRKVPTHIVEQSKVVKTSSSVVSTTIEITPTPTWQTIIVTPTATPPPPPPSPPPIDFQALLLKKEQERLALISKIKSLQSGSSRPPAAFGGIQAEVVEIPEKLESFSSLQHYLEQVREKKEQQVGGNPVAAPLVAELEPSPTPKLPSTTVSTIFMSGSKPGEYSTSLVTLTLNPEPARHRRQAEPAPVLATEIPEPLFEVELEGSFVPSPSVCKSATTVTVTVTAPPSQCQP